MTADHRFPYDWRLADGYPAPGVTPSGFRVFGTFICAGGSSMGYKLAGFQHLGGVEIDPRTAEIYKANHHPQFLFVEDLRNFNKRENLPAELFDLDILDGSPPCTTFSTMGIREKAWGKEKKFAEGQTKQRLDDLVFVWCETVAKLRPKVAWMENVSGLAKGNARAYLSRVLNRLSEIGYRPQCFLLDASKMGVPQARVRTFVLSLREDFARRLPKIRLSFGEAPIPFGDVRDRKDERRTLTDETFALWQRRRPTDFSLCHILQRLQGRKARFGEPILHDEEVSQTIVGSGQDLLYSVPRRPNDSEYKKIGSFPADFNFLGRPPKFFIGMSVPPVMAAQVAYQVRVQWLEKAAE